MNKDEKTARAVSVTLKNRNRGFACQMQKDSKSKLFEKTQKIVIQYIKYPADKKPRQWFIFYFFSNNGSIWWVTKKLFGSQKTVLCLMNPQ